MAKRPWVSPQEVKEYTEIKVVQDRAESRLLVDIARAEQYVIALTHNKFEESETIPAEVKTAVILLAEAYANNAAEQSKKVKSETFDDYSYTASDSSMISIESLDLASLLDAHTITLPKNGVTMRMRRL